MKEFYSMTIDQALSETQSNKKGLLEKEARGRLSLSADKHILPQKGKSIFEKLGEQFKDLMIIILLVASTISIVIGIVEGTSEEIIDGCIILGIVIMNAIIGVVQENKAEKALESLKKIIEPEGYVLRGGQVIKINNKKLVEGDIVLLQAGTIVPADLRLIESASLMIDESSLTGESFAVTKNASKVYEKSTPLADRHNMAYKGTTVTGGRGKGVVCAIGKESELGKIASAISGTEKEMTPLQKSIKDLGKILTYLVLAIAFVTFVLELFAHPNQPLQGFLTAVAIAVAAIPESMPAVITIIMSLGIARLAKQKAVVKRMHSVETLGCCDIICSDKTGTITENKMSVTSCYVDGILQEGTIKPSGSFSTFLAGLCLCNNSTLSSGKYIGDPTEVALACFAEKFKVNLVNLQQEQARLDEIPFSSKRKLMSTLCLYNGKKTVFVKGACDFLLKKCSFVMENGQIVQLSEDKKRKILDANVKMAKNALRVIALACKKVESGIEEDGLVFVGLAGMIDPPRKEIKKAVKKCKNAGMRTIMITGDHKETAFAIAKQIGIASSEDEVLTGSEVDALNDIQLGEKLKNVTVFARVSPENKARIVELLKKQGHIVAMTGDGVNDAPSLKKASIGIGMGITGTDVTKEVADIIVTDDNFATIVVAVEEGRKIYANIQKTVKFLFSANMGELLSLFFATIFFPSAIFLLPVQILFINLITDTLPAVALGLETPEKDLMMAPPRDAKKSLFSGGVGWSIVILGLVQTVLTIISYVIGLKLYGESTAMSMAFFTLNIIQMFYLFSMRTNGFILRSNPFKNKVFILAIVFTFGLLALINYTPLGTLLSLERLGGEQLAIIFIVSFFMLLASELFKLGHYLIQKKKKSHKLTSKGEN